MSCLNLSRFLPARKAWKKLTRKVQIKLNKLHPSSSKITIKKPPKTKTKALTKYRPPSSRKSSSCWPAAFCVQRKIFKLRPKQTRRYYLQKTVSPVFIDQLFVEPSVSGTVREEYAGRKGKAKVDEDGHRSADDMWESLGLGSPQMNGINQRAEEFITSFRAEMVLQERIARQLL